MSSIVIRALLNLGSKAWATIKKAAVVGRLPDVKVNGKLTFAKDSHVVNPLRCHPLEHPSPTIELCLNKLKQLAARPNCVELEKMKVLSCKCLEFLAHQQNHQTALHIANYMIEFRKIDPLEKTKTCMQLIRNAGAYKKGAKKAMFSLSLQGGITVNNLCQWSIMSILCINYHKKWKIAKTHVQTGVDPTIQNATTPIERQRCTRPWRGNFVKEELDAFLDRVETEGRTSHDPATGESTVILPFQYTRRSLYRKHGFEMGWIVPVSQDQDAHARDGVPQKPFTNWVTFRKFINERQNPKWVFRGGRGGDHHRYLITEKKKPHPKLIQVMTSMQSQLHSMTHCFQSGTLVDRSQWDNFHALHEKMAYILNRCDFEWEREEATPGKGESGASGDLAEIPAGVDLKTTPLSTLEEVPNNLLDTELKPEEIDNSSITINGI